MDDSPEDNLFDETQEEQEDPFALKYLPDHVCKKLWGYGYTLDVIPEKDDASSWQAMAISKIIDEKWLVVNAVGEELKRYLRDNYSSYFADGYEDLYWLVRPKAVVASSSCVSNARTVLLRCDCRIGPYHQIDIRFFNEELEGIDIK